MAVGGGAGAPKGLSILQQGALRAQLQMGHWQGLLHQVDGLLSRLQSNSLSSFSTSHPSLPPLPLLARMQVGAAGVAAAWRLGRWDLLKEYLSFVRASLHHLSNPPPGCFHPTFPLIPASHGEGGGGGGGGGVLSNTTGVLPPQDEWEVCVGSLLSSLHSGHHSAVEQGLLDARRDILTILPAIAQESYTRAYPQITKLAMLQELQDVYHLRHQAISGRPLPTSTELTRQLRWPQRLAAAQGSLSSQEPLLSLRRQLASLLGYEGEAGACWLQYAKLCRGMGHHEAAATATLQALSAGVPGAALERAKLLWHSGKERRALAELMEGITRISGSVQAAQLSNAPSSLVEQKKEEHAKLALQLAKWTAVQGQMGYTDLKRLFEDAVNINPHWEKVYYQYARYLDSLFQDAKRRQTGAATGAGGGVGGVGGGGLAVPTMGMGSRGGSRGGPSSSSAKTVLDRLGGRSKIVLGEEKPFFEYLPDILSNYGRCIELGYTHVLQCLPRMLTLYCEFGNEQCSTRSKTQGTTQAERLAITQVINLMKTFSKSIAPVAWLVTLPQLISRICHPNPDVTEVLQCVLVRCLESFPHQALWSMACLLRSSSSSRKNMANKVLNQVTSNCPLQTKDLVDSFSSITSLLIKLCLHTPSGSMKNSRLLSAKAECKNLLAALPRCGVMVPIQEAFAVPLPATPLPVSGRGGNNPSTHNTSSSNNNNGAAGNALSDPPVVTIVGMEDQITVMSSLQRPKKIVLLGSDGRPYPFLAKPKDDLRKDNRLMDFASVANTLFSAQASSRRRGLRIRTYYVVVLTEDCGLLQWLMNLTTFKHTCEESLGAEGFWKKQDTPKEIKKLYDAWTEPKKAPLMDKVLQLIPPRTHKWWLAQFPEPAAWLQARLNFTRTNAVWCMTGHILGLGDRHGENIMIDQISGETVNVDFGCLFDKGLTLEIPEMVPFRLTQNVVDGFGVAGVEGAFRKSAENAMQVLRQHRSTLMTSAETFLYDPLVDWNRGSKSYSQMDKGDRGGGGGQLQGAQQQQGVGGEAENPMAKDALATMEGRLSGTLLGVSSQPSLPLSVEGQVQRLISEACDKENLGRMYIWWMAWM